MIVETRYEHIVLDETKAPVIEGTTMKVIEHVLDSRSYGWSPEELHFQHPHLTLGQIHSALASIGIIRKNLTRTLLED